MDIDKSEFFVKRTKYLGFILEVGEGIEWTQERCRLSRNGPHQDPVKGVRGFIGFANFYRQFIPSTPKLVAPLQALTSAKCDLEALHLTERKLEERLTT